MTIDEAIEMYTSNAEYQRTHGNLQGCLEFRQLAEWLRDYKRLKEQKPTITSTVIKQMRDATPEEQEAITKYIKSISKPTGIEFDIDIDKKVESYGKLLKHPVVKHIMGMDEEQEQLDFVQPHKRIPVTLTVGGDLISRQAAVDTIQHAFDRETLLNSFVRKVAVDALKTMPSVKPQTGHWVKGKCDQCGGHAPFWSMATTYYESEYCPNCGARMVKPQKTKQPEISSYYGLKSYVRERSE